MHLALIVFEKIKTSLFNTNQQTNDMIMSYEYHKEHLLYASLLHDIGHSPFSHIGEKFYNKESIIKKIKNEIFDKSLVVYVDFLEENKKNIAAHELMSCYVIVRKFTNKILKKNQHDASNTTVDLEYIFRIICGIKYKPDKTQEKRNIMNTIISIVNSETIDVDKIDYILRDNRAVGYIGPRIDINRIIKSIIINKNSDGLMFTHMGISALQGLIDCRDTLYLWVFNHHTVVYTDYLYQRCFTLFDKLHKKNGKPNEWMSLNSFFSCDAIADNCVSDVEALSMINKAFKLIEHENDPSKYSTTRIVKQFMNRNFLKPLWKTINEFNGFMNEIVGKKDDEHGKLIEYMNNWNNRITLIKEISEELNIAYSNLFIIKRENKFCETILDSLYVLVDNKPKLLKSILPIKHYEEVYKKTAFYVYCEEQNKTIVKKTLISKLRKKMNSDIQSELNFE
jgi:HD superfamily phosphohydrolase